MTYFLYWPTNDLALSINLDLGVQPVGVFLQNFACSHHSVHTSHESDYEQDMILFNGLYIIQQFEHFFRYTSYLQR